MKIKLRSDWAAKKNPPPEASRDGIKQLPHRGNHMPNIHKIRYLVKGTQPGRTPRQETHVQTATAHPKANGSASTTPHSPFLQLLILCGYKVSHGKGIGLVLGEVRP